MMPMSLYEQLDRYRAAIRRILICCEALPELPTLHTEWRLLPAGRPEGLPRETRYVLAIYRAALAEQVTLRNWLVQHRAQAGWPLLMPKLRCCGNSNVPGSMMTSCQAPPSCPPSWRCGNGPPRHRANHNGSG